MKYEIVLSKDLKIGDIIIHNGGIILINQIYMCIGAGSFDFGEYISVKATNCGTYPSDGLFDFWLYRELPVVKVTK